jgi:hypothetical protein
LQKEFIDFTYEVDSIIDLSCDVPSIKNQVELKNSEVIFDQYETMKNERLVPAMLASSMASHFLSPNGYLAFSTTFDSLTPPKDKKLVPTNFMDLMTSRVIMQSAVNMAASRSYASSLTSSLNKDNIYEGVIYFNTCVNTLLLGPVNTKYTRELYPQANPKLWIQPEGLATLLKMWARGDSRPENGAYVGFRTEGKRGKIIFPEYY